MSKKKRDAEGPVAPMAVEEGEESVAPVAQSEPVQPLAIGTDVTPFNAVGIPDERAQDIIDANPADAGAMKATLNGIGYYDEKADHLAGVGVTPGA